MCAFFVAVLRGFTVPYMRAGSIGGTSTRGLLGSSLLDIVAAKLLDMPNNFMRTPAKREGAATNGVSFGALPNKDLGV